jgi:phage-related baseplate assembly protein
VIAATINWNAQASAASAFLSATPPTILEVRTTRSLVSPSKPVFSVETCIQLELSLVAEVERVFVDRAGDGSYKIISVVNQRDAAIREKVYAREEEIMAAYPTMTFDFHVLARMNRRLEDVITNAKRVVFER